MAQSQAYHPADIFVTESITNLDTPTVNTQWYPTSYAWDQSYITPMPTSAVENPSWNQLPRSSAAPETPLLQHFATHQPRIVTVPSYPAQFKDPSRPRSSPSTFGPTSEGYTWPYQNGLGIYASASLGQPTPITSTFPPNMFQTYPSQEHQHQPQQHFSLKDEAQHALTKPDQQQPTLISSPPEIIQPQPRRPYPNLAPDPAGIAAAQKRKRDEDDYHTQSTAELNQQQQQQLSKKRKRTSSVASADLSEDDRLLVSLKEEQNLPWRDIAARYSAEKGKAVQVAALQMRYKRLRERHRVWTDVDDHALRQAYELWESKKFEIIAEKMLEFGVEEKWNPKQVQKRWDDFKITAAASVAPVPTLGLTPAMSQFSASQFSSPIEAPGHYAWQSLI